MNHENAKQRPALGDGVEHEQRSMSSLIFQSLDAVEGLGVGTGAYLLGKAALKQAGNNAPEQQPPPPADPSTSKQAD